MKVLNPGLGKTVEHDMTAEAGYPQTIISNSAPWWILKNQHGEVLCSNYKHDETEAIMEMVEWVMHDEFEPLFAIYGDVMQCLEKMSEHNELFVAEKCGSNRREIIKTIELLAYT